MPDLDEIERILGRKLKKGEFIRFIGYSNKDAIKSAKRTRKEEDEINKSFRCTLCRESFRTQEELSKHQYYDCMGGWTK